ncbi:MAG TPA: hypothetical protein EYH07_00285 [Kiloniellaceae bacterium]|nr:hypothetical protein [Kiloniellaceae bacterium]
MATGAYRTTFQHGSAIAVAMAFPLLVSQVSWYLCFFTIGGAYDGLIWLLITILPECLFTVAICRLVLLGTRTGQPRWLPAWQRRHNRVLLLLLVLLPIWFPLLIADTYVEEIAGITLSDTEEWARFGLGVFASYLYLRLALALTATSVDEDFGLLHSWRASRGQGLRIFAASIIAYVPLAITITACERFYEGWAGYEYAWPDGPEDPTFGWHLMLANVFDDGFRYLTLTLDLIILSSAFSHLTGWSLDRREILERFE